MRSAAARAPRSRRPAWPAGAAAPRCRSRCATSRSEAGRRSGCRSSGRACRRAAGRRSAVPASEENQPGSGTDIELCVVTSATSSSGRSHSSLVAVARPACAARRSWCRRCRRRSPTSDRDHDGGDRQRREPPAAKRRAGARAAAASLAGAVDQPQQRADALVDQVDPERAHQQRRGRRPVDEHDHARRHERRPAERPARRPPRLGGDPVDGHAAAARRTARGLISEAAAAATTAPDAGEYPGGGAKVAEEGVPDGPRGRLLVRCPGHGRPRSSGRPSTPPRAARRPRPRPRPARRRSGACRARGGARPPRARARATSSRTAEQLDPLGDVREGRAQAADVPLDDLHALGRLELVGERRAHLLERRREHGARRRRR